jgi:hypothetical protein
MDGYISTILTKLSGAVGYLQFIRNAPVWQLGHDYYSVDLLNQTSGRNVAVID